MPQQRTTQPRTKLTLAVLAVVALALYGATLFRFGVMMGGGP